MERDGGVYGYSLAARVAERTAGAWRPGPGAIYPALQRLADRGLAKSHGDGRRREYRITPEGRRLLRKVRRERGATGGSGPDLSLLWAEILGVSDDSTYLWLRLRRSLESIESHLNRAPASRFEGRSLREYVVDELRASERRLSTGRLPGRRKVTV
jgi:DNA-binding PadR family transcriptional regulator